jgi:hypothetical protein
VYQTPVVSQAYSLGGESQCLQADHAKDDDEDVESKDVRNAQGEAQDHRQYSQPGTC